MHRQVSDLKAKRPTDTHTSHAFLDCRIQKEVRVAAVLLVEHLSRQPLWITVQLKTGALSHTPKTSMERKHDMMIAELMENECGVLTSHDLIWCENNESFYWNRWKVRMNLCDCVYCWTRRGGRVDRQNFTVCHWVVSFQLSSNHRNRTGPIRLTIFQYVILKINRKYHKFEPKFYNIFHGNCTIAHEIFLNTITHSHPHLHWHVDEKSLRFHPYFLFIEFRFSVRSEQHEAE